MMEDTYLSTSDMAWLEFGGGIDFKVLRASQETGAWTVLFRCKAGSSFNPHRHLGGGEYFMLKGTMQVRGGKEKGGITATAGDYGYEPNGVLHDETFFPEDSELYFTNYGAIQFLTPELEPDFVLDFALLQELASTARKAAA
ncbi:MAG: 2,4'-dihydroxyacetophenone dioxygenase family protein [Gammaproteobacteria bacterium]